MEEVVSQDPDAVERLQTLLDEGKSYREISDVLKATHTSIYRGLSACSVTLLLFKRSSKKNKCRVGCNAVHTLYSVFS